MNANKKQPEPDFEEPLLETLHLTKVFPPRGGFLSGAKEPVHAVIDVNLVLEEGENLGILGESGCGKSTLGRMLLGLIEPTAGTVFFREHNLFELPKDKKQKVRKQMQLVFQDPLGSLNPRMRTGKAVVEPLIVHGMLNGRNWKEAANEAFEQVGLDGSLITRFPHELSGGQRQRVCIARALATDPAVLVADEPVASLDISIQTQILTLFDQLFGQSKRSLILISHDVRVVKALCDRIMVMYLGQVVESADRDTIFDKPAHPYTKKLLDSVCALHPDEKHVVAESEESTPANQNLGCPFEPRCDRSTIRCTLDPPPETYLADGRMVRCFFPLTEEHPLELVNGH